LNMAGWA
ncbi:putative membrane protein, partial [Vibrio parahaemolyticus V-223/04]